jgi:ABC-2 type transport system ATP-binding protein
LEVIETDQLSKSYGGIKALSDLTIKIKPGQAVGFLGPNGAGKSTTIKILCGLIRATNGRAWVGGVEVTPGEVQHLSKVGALVEVPEFYPYVTPMEILGYLGRLRGMKSQDISIRADEVLGDVDLMSGRTRRSVASAEA